LPIAAQEHHIIEDLDASLAEVRSSRPPAELLGGTRVDGLLIHLAKDWAIVIGSWIALTRAPAYFYPALWVIIGGRLHAFGVLLHDAGHLPLRRKSRKHRCIEIFAGYPIATTLNAIRYHHLRHHKDCGMETDPYYKAVLERKPWMAFPLLLMSIGVVPFWTIRGLVSPLAYSVPAFRNFYARVFLQDRSKQDLTHSAELIQCAKEDRYQGLFSAGVIAILVLYPKPVMNFYLIPLALAALFAGYRSLREHRHKRVRDRKIQSIMAITRDQSPGILPTLFGKLFLAPHNVGHHIAHHLHPQVSLENLPKLTCWYQKNYPDYFPKRLS